LLPCGLLYTALLAASAAGGALQGAAAMFLFGLGTVPALLAVGIAGQAAARRWQRAIGKLAPILLLINAAILGLMATQMF
jgi:sulfite exporter TauE/SafE